MGNDNIYTHRDGEKYIEVKSPVILDCEGCAFNVNDNCSVDNNEVEDRCLNNDTILKLQTPLDAAEADLAEKGTPIGEARTPDTDSVKDPSHYADSYPGDIEVYDMIRTLLNSLDLSGLNPYQIYQLGNVFKYRLRAGYKDDGGEVWGQVDLAKAMRCREMIDE